MNEQKWHDLPEKWKQEKRHPMPRELVAYLKSLDWCFISRNTHCPTHIVHSIIDFMLNAQYKRGYEDGNKERDDNE